MPHNKILISIVIPCYNESYAFPHLKKALMEFENKLNPKYRCEYLLIDDGSSDNTWAQIIEFEKENGGLRVPASPQPV